MRVSVTSKQIAARRAILRKSWRKSQHYVRKVKVRSLPRTDMNILMRKQTFRSILLGDTIRKRRRDNVQLVHSFAKFMLLMVKQKCPNIFLSLCI